MQYPLWSWGGFGGSASALRAIGAAAALGLGAAALTGCVAHVEPADAYDVEAEPVRETRVVYGYPVVEVETVPMPLVSYPRVYFRGSYAYLVDGRWYYRDRGRWVVFRREPRELTPYRLDYERRRRMQRDRPPSEVEIRDHR